MECEQCGSRRPRTGPCPDCGALPTSGSHSSLSQWKNNRPGRSAADGDARGGRGSGTLGGQRQAGRGRGSSASRSDPGASQRVRRGANREEWDDARDDGWVDDDGYLDERQPGRSGRQRGYEEVDLERALVPAADMLPMGGMEMGVGLPALPGFPETDEEERALGIRRPVYIPATGNKRKQKLGSFRVVSGVLSVMLVCIASFGLAGLVGRAQIARFIQGPIAVHMTPTLNPLAKYVAATPAGTPGPKASILQSITTARAHDARFEPIDVTSHFPVGADIWVIVITHPATDGKPHTLSVEWYEQGVNLQLRDANTSKTLPSDGQSHIADFDLSVPSPGVGTAKVFWDKPANDPGTAANDPYLAQTIYFSVDAPTPTATAKPATSPSASPKPSATTTPKAFVGSPPVALRGSLLSW